MVCVCVWSVHSYLVIHFEADDIKHHTPTTLHNRYKAPTEYRQQSMTEQALRECVGVDK